MSILSLKIRGKVGTYWNSHPHSSSICNYTFHHIGMQLLKWSLQHCKFAYIQDTSNQTQYIQEGRHTDPLKCHKFHHSCIQPHYCSQSGCTDHRNMDLGNRIFQFDNLACRVRKYQLVLRMNSSDYHSMQRHRHMFHRSYKNHVPSSRFLLGNWQSNHSDLLSSQQDSRILLLDN